MLQTKQNIMQLKQNPWIRQPQECDGDYWFNGKILITRNVSESIPRPFVIQIVEEVQRLAVENKGIDYLITFKNEEGDTLFFIDQVTRTALKNGDHPPEHHYATLMFSWEY